MQAKAKVREISFFAHKSFVRIVSYSLKLWSGDIPYCHSSHSHRIKVISIFITLFVRFFSLSLSSLNA